MAVNENPNVDFIPNSVDKDNQLFAGRVIVQIMGIVDFVRFIMTKDNEE